MRRSHIILLSMLVLAVLAAGAVAAIRMFGHERTPSAAVSEGRVYRIAVATEETLGRREEISSASSVTKPGSASSPPGQAQAPGGAAANAAKSPPKKTVDQVYLSEQSLPSGDGKGKVKLGSDGKSAPATPGEAEAGEAAAPQQPAVSLTIEDLRQILGAQLEGQLTGTLAATKRFKPLEVTQVQAAIDKLRRSNEPDADEKKKREAEEKPRSGPIAKFGHFLSAARQSSQATIRPDGSVEATSLVSREEIRRRFIDGANLADVGGSLQADYFLFVTIDEPVFSYRQVVTALGKRRLIFTAKPTYLYRLFNVKSGTVELAGVAQLPQAITEGLDWEPSTRERMITGDQRGAREIDSVTRVISDLTFKVNQTASRLVVQAILDKVSPAKIVRSGDTIMINRGVNDGVVKGQEMEVYRLGAEVRDDGDSGALLDREQRYIGVVRVVNVLASSAAVEVAGGDRPAVGDVVRLAAATAASAAPAATADGLSAPAAAGVALGEAALLEQQAGAPAKPLVAVGDVSVGFTEDNDFAEEASRRLADALRLNPRITVLPRADLQRVLRERALNAEAAGDFASIESQGLAQSGYIVTGETFLEKRTTQDKVTFGGVTRSSGPARTSYVARGSFRAQTIDGRAVAAADASVTRAGSSPDEALRAIDDLMRAGAQKLLQSLFPIRVVRQEGAEVVLGAGQDAGLAVGQRLIAYSVGAPVVDPLTKVVLSPGSRRKAGELVVRSVDAGASMAAVVGAQFTLKQGDVVEPAGAGGAAAAPPAAGASGKRAAAPAAAKPAESAPPPVRF